MGEFSVLDEDGRTQVGPVDGSTLERLAREGRVGPRSRIVDHAAARQYLACDLPEIAAILSAPPVVAPATRFGAASVPVRSPRSRLVAGLLGVLLPGLGAHRFYLGHTGIGILQIVATFACGIGIVWGFVEGIVCFAGGMKDAEGRPLTG